MHAHTPTQVGFTLVELIVTIAIAAILGLMVVPNLVSMVDSGRTSVLVNQFPQDVAWARNLAVSTKKSVQITLSNNGCSWVTTVDSGATAQDISEGAAHSLTLQQLNTQFPTAQCTLVSNPPAGGILMFNTQGLVVDGNNNPASPIFQVQDGHGQTWTVQMLASGSVILNSNTAS